MKPMLKCNAYQMRQLRWLAPLLLILLLVGCKSGPAIKPDLCAGWAAIYPSKADVLSDGTAKQILAHDLHGVEQGCWAAPKRR